MADKDKTPEPESIIFEPAPELEAAVAKAQQPAEDKAVKPAANKAARFKWEPTSSDGKQAQDGHWRMRVQQLGATGLWRPFVEYVGDDYKTEQAAEKALERLLK